MISFGTVPAVVPADEFLAANARVAVYAGE